MKPSIAVLGAGSWGSAVAIHLAKNDCPVTLWEYQTERLKEMTQTRMNSEYLPDVVFPGLVTMEQDVLAAVKNKAIIFIAVPSHAFADLLHKIKPALDPKTIISWGTKGLVDGKFLHQVAHEILGDQHSLVAVSGPSFAKEVAKGLPTALAVVSEDLRSAELLVGCFRSPTFRPYIGTDIQGAELGSVVKNVLAIAVGISDGLGFGANARAALITRGLAEMKSLGQHLGAIAETFDGLTGLGDLILTATDNQSRNRRFGLALGEGLKQEVAKNRIGQVVEGARNAAEIHALAKKFQIEMPICERVYKIIYEGMKPREAVTELFQRGIKFES